METKSLRRVASLCLLFGAFNALEAASTVPSALLEQLSSGANVARWFRFPVSESAEHFANYIPDEEMALMRRIGLRHIRLCIAPKEIMDTATGAIREDRFKNVESAIERFLKADLAVVIDIHNEDRKGIEESDAWRNAFDKFWADAARRWSRFDPEKVVLEIVNEPVFQGRETEWPPLQERFFKTIRSAAPKHTIIVSGPNWGGIDGLKKLKPLADSNVIYSFHTYDPFPFSHQGATWTGGPHKVMKNVPYPSSPEAVAPLLPELEKLDAKARDEVRWYGEQRWNLDKLRARFREGIEWGAKNDVTLYCGEFGVYPVASKAEDRAAWFHDFGTVLRENKIGWAVWGWDEGFGINRQGRGEKAVLDPVATKSLGLKPDHSGDR
jgi:aryl-phospho-beta-D-glucosidase BglC (GH1 family)